ncbi:response regulator transcription factor [Desulfatiferula olefinivorans]
MKILLVEDQSEKREQIKDFLKYKSNNNITIIDKESLRGGLKEIVKNTNYDMILLDMSMPNFDISVDNPVDCSPESFAGKEFLAQMKLRNIHIPVIVITQYSSFEGGTITLKKLTEEFSNDYGDFYLGSVYFNSAVDTWKEDLLNLLRGSDEWPSTDSNH